MPENNIIQFPHPSLEEIRTEAYHRYEARIAENRPGNEQTDWQEAHDALHASYAEQRETAPAQSAPDKLTAIKGLGPVSEKRLAELGVTTFAQIASWTPEMVTDFGNRLGLANRIERDDWVGQAQTLAKSSQVA